ncbi:MAG: hypothetical protein ABUL58_08545, partial [Steroidobacter sp.]
GILASEIISPNGPRATQAAVDFITSLGQGPVTAPVASTAPSAVGRNSSAASSQSSSVDGTKANGLVNYPMEDKNPGAEPPK